MSDESWKSDPVAADFMSAWVEALNRGDLAAVIDAYDDPCLLLPTLSNRPCRDRASLEGYFKVLVERGVSVEVESVETLRDGELATASGMYVFSFRQGPPPLRLRARFTFVASRTSGRWKIRAHHSSMTPFPDQRNREPIPFGDEEASSAFNRKKNYE